MSNPDPTPAKLEAALAAHNPGVSVQTYFSLHYEAFAMERAKWNGKVVDFWTITAETFRAAGIVGGRGRPLNGPALRIKWDRFVARLSVASAPTPFKPPEEGWKPQPVSRSNDPVADVSPGFQPTRKL